MKIDFKKLSDISCQRIERPQTKYSYFLPISPYGYGTGDTESISSLICRQAEQLLENSHSFCNRVVMPHAQIGPHGKNPRISIKDLHGCNGIGLLASRFITAINNEAKGRFDAKYLTLTPIKNICTQGAHGLRRSNMAWCKDCWKDDIHGGRTPYFRLFWTLQCASVCPTHHRKLSEYCPACHAIKTQFPGHPRQWLCDKCGFVLYQGADDGREDNFTSEMAWTSYAAHKLIDRIYADRLAVDGNSIPRAIQRILKVTNLDLGQFSDLLNIDRQTMRSTIKGESTPGFATLLDICYRMDIPLDQFILDSDILTSPDMWRKIGRPYFHSSSHLGKERKARISKYLQQLIQKDPSPPVRTTHIADKFGISYTTLCYNFPHEYKILRSRFTIWERKQRCCTHTDRLQRVSNAAFSLVKHGVYPSDRKLRDLGHALSSDLRREDVICILRAIQAVYSDLNPTL